MFAKYHYLDSGLNKAAHCYVMTVNDVLCGFCAVLSFAHPHLKNTWRAHRTVVLPDFQGVGLGNFLSATIADKYLSEKKNFISTTTNPAMIFARKKDPRWITTRIGRAAKPNSKSKIHIERKDKSNTSCRRITASFKYIGDNNGERKETKTNRGA
tara:strand:+ start:1214 stop:1678 length:465 start_codon:yes stop_codon:yes gene_type:complete